MLLKSYQLHGEWEQGKGISKYRNINIETFVNFCRKRHTDPIQANTDMGIKFLTQYFKAEGGYSSVISARPALSRIIEPVCNVPFGK